jgi:hypothetical protein
MRILLLVFLALLSTASGAAESRRFAVLSLLGDKLLVAQYFPNQGFRQEGGLQAFVSLDDNSLDKTVLQAADAAIKTMDRGNKPVLLVAKDTTLYAAQENLLTTGQSSKLILDKMGPMLRGSGATHLILFSKIRHEARVQQLKDTFIGSGTLEGLGFYVDAGRVAPPTTPGEPALGGMPVLGPFAYFKVELIDLARGEVLKQETVLASKTYSTPGSSNAWATLTNAEKITALQDIIRHETAKAVPVLLGAPRLN